LDKIQSFRQINLNINYLIIAKGKPHQKILQYSKKHKIDLLIIGNHGKFSIRDNFVDITAEYIIDHTKCPV
jgi:nucleotide-binding universal stress UspA family protein